MFLSLRFPVNSIFVVLSVILMTACGSKTGKTANSEASTNSSGALSIGQIQGAWRGQCYPGEPGGSLLESLIVNGSYIKWRWTISSTTNNCTAPDFNMDINGTFTLGAASSAVPGATNISMTSVNGGVTLLNAAAVTAANSGSWCGFNNWQLNVTKTVDISCVSDSPAGSFDDIVSLVGTTLTFGNEDGTALDPNYSFQKQ